MPPPPRQYLIVGAGVLLIFITGSLIHQFGVPTALPYVSMHDIKHEESKLRDGMAPYPLMDHPPLENIYASPSPKRIAVVMSVHQQTPLFQASYIGHQEYCQIHGYRFMTQSKYLLPEEPFPHPVHRGHEYQKMAVLMQALMIGLDTREFDWILWTDLDTYVIDPSIPLEALLPDDTQPRYFLGNRDFNGFNAGALFLKVDPWSVQLLAMAMADPYNLYNSGALDDDKEYKPAVNDQASLSRIFQHNDLFGKHFQEIPDSWMNRYPPYELDGKLNTTIPQLLPDTVVDWVKRMDEAASFKASGSKKEVPTPLDSETLEQLRPVLELPSHFIPDEFKGSLQIHLVNDRKKQFEYEALVSMNAQMMQVATAALVLQYHEKLSPILEPIALWEHEKRESSVGLKYVQNPDLFNRRDRWFTERRIGIEGMSWLDGR